MSSQALLKLSGIGNDSSVDKEEEVLSVLVAELPHRESILHYVNALIKQPTLPIRPILNRFIDYIDSGDDLTEGDKLELYKLLVDLFRPPTAVVNYPLIRVVSLLSKIYETRGEFSESIDLLKILHVESLGQEFDTLEEFKSFRVEINTRIAKNCLKLEQYEDAEAYISRILPLLTELDIDRNRSLILDTYQTSTQILIRIGKWYEAASKLLYNNVEGSGLQVIKFAILAQYDSRKTRLLAHIINSKKSFEFDIRNTPIYPIFEKIYNKRLIYGDEFDALLRFYYETNNEGLPQDYLSVSISKAMTESNLAAASLIYANTKISTFSKILNLDEEYVEQITSEMIRDGRLNATVDDIDKIIDFSQGCSEPLKIWTDHIVDSCLILDSIVSKISSENPQLVDLHLDQ